MPLKYFRMLAEGNDEQWFPLFEEPFETPFDGTLADESDAFAIKIHYQIFHAAYMKVLLPDSPKRMSGSRSSSVFKAASPSSSEKRKRKLSLLHFARVPHIQDRVARFAQQPREGKRGGEGQ